MTSVNSNFNFLCGRPHGAWPLPHPHASTWAWPPPFGRHKWMAPKTTWWSWQHICSSAPAYNGCPPEVNDIFLFQRLIS